MWNSAYFAMRSVHLPVSQDSLKSSGTNLQFSAPCSAVPGLQPPPAGWLWMLWHQPTSLILQLQKELKACVCTQWLHHSPSHLVRLDWPNNCWAWLPTSSWHKWLYRRDINLLSEQCTVSGSWPMLCLEQGLICLWITAHRVRDKMNLSSSVRKWVKKVGKGKTVGMFGTRLLSLGSWLELRWEEAWDQRSQCGEQSGGWALRARRGKKEENACKERGLFSANTATCEGPSWSAIATSGVRHNWAQPSHGGDVGGRSGTHFLAAQQSTSNNRWDWKSWADTAGTRHYNGSLFCSAPSAGREAWALQLSFIW